MREQNRIHQMAFKVWKKMPKDFKSFQMVAEHLLRNAHRYYKTDEEKKIDLNTDVKKEEMIEENQSRTLTKQCESENMERNPTEVSIIDVNKMLHENRTLKRQNRIREQQELVNNLKKKVGVYREIA